jgi:UDP-N-acetylmuramoylalanine--D-glutamate ligase
LRGAHNAQNAAAAVAVAMAMGVPAEKIRSGLYTFPGLPHRMEEVGRVRSTLFINDSKATNADSTEKALKSFDNILWILGGKPKEGGIAPLKPYFSKIRKAYLIGAASDEFAATLGADVPHVHCVTLDKAVEQAAHDAAVINGPAVVLLSPACASYDQYPNYEVRGNHFRELVKALPGINPTMGA